MVFSRLMIFAFVPAAILLAGALPCQAQPATNLWRLQISERGCDSSPALAADGTVYAGTFEGKLLAVMPDGEIRWTFKAGREIKSSPAVAGDGTIYFGSRDRKLYAIGPDGKLKWTFETGAWVDSSPAIEADGTIYFGSWDTNFYAINPNGSLKWKYPAGGIIDSSPAIAADGTLYFGSHDKYFYALSPDGKLRWKFLTQGPITSSPAIADDGAIYFTSTDGNLYALGPGGGEQWHLAVHSYTASSPIVGDKGRIYLNAADKLLCIGRDGKKIWDWTTAPVWVDASPLALSKETICFSWPWRLLIAIGSNHDIQSQVELTDNINTAPVISNGETIYTIAGRFLTATALTNRFPLLNSSWPMFHANPQHTGRVQSGK
jgi:outer membrane protein assembly factor BamB